MNFNFKIKLVKPNTNKNLRKVNQPCKQLGKQKFSEKIIYENINE